MAAGAGRSPHSVRTIVRPNSRIAALDLRILWTKRELLYYFVWRDVKVRYKQTAFGALWALIQPLALMAVFALVFSRLQGIAPPGVPYPVFALAALVPWTLFAQSTLGASESVVEAANVIQKVYFPRLLLPVGAAGSYLIDYVIGMLMLTLLALAMGVVPDPNVLWILPLTLLVLTSSLAVGVWLAALNVRYRDVRYAVPFLLQLWLFATPVAYSAAIVPNEYWLLYHLNPMAGAVEGFRWALIGGFDAPIGAVLVATAVAVVLLASGLAYFRRTERTFADVI